MIFWIVLISTFCLMEGVAWLTHKYVMHGFLWRLHRDHHTHENKGFLEKNDSFFLIFAIPGALFIVFGSLFFNDVLLAVGLGITAYGLGYFLIHDVFIHRRLKWLKKANGWYFKAIRRAHKMHHIHKGKENGECFGMLWVPFKYLRSPKSK